MQISSVFIIANGLKKESMELSRKIMEYLRAKGIAVSVISTETDEDTLSVPVDTDLVITGEGRMDWQSAFGKVPSGVGKRCRKAGVPAAAIVGGLLKGYETIYDTGIRTVITTINGAMDLQEAMERSEELYRDAAVRLFRAIACGMEINKM